MSCYTTKAQAYIKQIDSDPGYIPVDRDNYERLREINQIVLKWLVQFNATVREYKTQQQLYKLTYINEDGTLDFLNWLQS